MPVRNRIIKRKTDIAGKIRKRRLVILLAALLLVISIGAFYFLSIKYFHSDSKLILAVNDNDKGTVVAIFDPANFKITTVSIPPNMQVLVAAGRGTWKMGSLWKLSNQEKEGGELFVHTIAKNLYIPVYVWADKNSLGFLDPNPARLLIAVFGRYKTNLTWADKIKLALFSLGVDKLHRENIDLTKGSFLTSKQLVDGESGFVVNESLVQSKLMVIFSDARMVGKNVRISINRLQAGTSFSNMASRIIEMMGGRVVSIVNIEEDVDGCVVISKDNKIALGVARVFSCKALISNPVGNIDVEVKFGREFTKQF